MTTSSNDFVPERVMAAVALELRCEPVKSVWMLQQNNMEATAAVLIEQCGFDPKIMCRALVEAFGGWREFGICLVVGTTPEGFIVEAENTQAEDYLESLYEIVQF